MYPSTGGVWSSTDLGIALVDNNGKVTGVAPGKVSFSYTEIETGCISRMMLDAVTVKPCLDPDFNITSLNTVVKGNISTNDEVVAGMTYGALPFHWKNLMVAFLTLLLTQMVVMSSVPQLRENMCIVFLFVLQTDHLIAIFLS